MRRNISTSFRGAALLAMLLLLPLLTSHGLAEELGDITIPHTAPGPIVEGAVMFPHWIHRMQFRCSVCHDAIFQMKAGGDAITMDDISKGKYCGTCHNGKTAFAVGFDTCDRCHLE